MERHQQLRDGTDVVVRTLAEGDTDASHAFFEALPEADRRYLRTDVTRRELVERRIQDVEAGRVVRLVAMVGAEIVGDGSLELVGHGWGDGVAEVRLIIARRYQRRGLGTLMARELYLLAAERRVERIVVRVMAPQTRALAVFRKLGFDEEFVIPGHIRDQAGVWQDMVIMRCDRAKAWRKLEAAVDRTDLRRQVEQRTGLD